MDPVRDLSDVEPWPESLEPWRESLARSRARRGKPMPSSGELSRWRVDDAAADESETPRAHARRRRPLGPTHSRRPILVLASSAGVLVLALLWIGLRGGSDRLGSRASDRITAAGVSTVARAHAAASAAKPAPGASEAAVASPRPFVDCQRVRAASGYVNPLARAVVTPRRIDQGVDYAGSGTLAAIGPGVVTLVAISATGWPGAFIEYELTAGPAEGCFVFYAEGVTPARGLEVGETLRPGELIATMIPAYSDGIEIGWGAGVGTTTYAAKMGEWSGRSDAGNIPTEAGRSFSSLIASLGGPPGKIEG